MCSFRDQETLDTMLRLIVIGLLFTICFGFKQGRIVDGNPTEITEHPYQVSLESEGYHFCGGSIISPDWVVTAAHCVTEGHSISVVDPSTLQVRAGSSYSGEGGSVHQVSKIIVHPEYAVSNDIAVLKVSPPFVFNDTVKPIPMATVSPSGGATAVVTGWGNGQYQLQELDVGIIDKRICNMQLFFINNSMLCAKALRLFKGPCSGDSGGPLVSNGKLVGVASFVIGSCAAGFPDVYADVAYLRNWVESVTGVA
ncbi:hypothetical protein L9F63_026542 [Diploptera punctata]|uniref:Peptidase S1 domain-containing protein n=1 Tax=Diploptera punctata TaxID=6984 RepID=A0AAD8AHK8_DIPPU|nr:hypothetical protein L9F63_026542 [Diploptera punctata]